MTISFAGLENPNVRLLEAVITAASEAECFASTDLSNARVLGPDRAILTYDTAAGTTKLTWTTPKENRNSCRILMVDGDVDGRDFLVWQRSTGTSGLAEVDLMKTDDSGEQHLSDGSIRFFSYSTSIGLLQ